MELLERHFEIAIETPDGIKKLRELILTLAMQGKLVPQDPKDQPASELLKEIEGEKKKLLKVGKIKKIEELPPIKTEEIPYEVPKGWEWVLLHNVIDVRDGTHDTPKYMEIGVPLVTSKNFKNGEIDFSDVKRISKTDHELIRQRYHVENDDILFSMIGGNIGNMVIVNTDQEFSIKNVALYKYYNKKLTIPKFLFLFLKTITFVIQNKAAGGAQPFVSLSFLRNYLMPLPPVNEQKRIVARVDQLMELCDSLDQHIKDSSEKKSAILNAVLAG